MTNNSTLVFNPVITGSLSPGVTFTLDSVKDNGGVSIAGCSMDSSTGILSLNTQNVVNASSLVGSTVTFQVTMGGVTSSLRTLDITSLFGAGTTAGKLRTDKAKFTGPPSTLGSEGTTGTFITSPTIVLSPGVSVPSTAAYGGDFTIPFSSITVFASDGGSLMVNYSVAQTGYSMNVANFHIPITCAGTAYSIDYSIVSLP